MGGWQLGFVGGIDPLDLHRPDPAEQSPGIWSRLALGFFILLLSLGFWPVPVVCRIVSLAAVSEFLPRNASLPSAIVLVAVCAIGLARKNKTEQLDYRNLYTQGHMLFDAGEYERALPVLNAGAALSCDPMFHNIIGRCYEALGQDMDAEREYLRAHFMVPGRLYPLVLLEELYLSRGDSLRAREMFSAIESIPVNPKNPNMKSLRERAEKNLAK